MAVFNKFYRCKECYKENGGLNLHFSNSCIHCYLCGGAFVWGIKNTTDIYNHNKTYHGIDLQFSFAPKNLLNSKRMMAFNALGPLLPDNPQFSVLTSNDADLPEELFGDIKFGKSDVMSYDNYLTLIDIVEAWLKGSSKTYSCLFCGEDYDSIPTLKIVRGHIKKCTMLHSNNTFKI